MPISPLFTSIYEQEIQIDFLNCYPNGNLRHTDLCNIMQRVAGFHAELGGVSFSDMQNYNQAWVLSRILIEIKRLPIWKDTIKVKTWINSLENSKSIRCIEIYHNGEKIVGCETFWVAFNTTTRRPEIASISHEHFEKYDSKATLRNVEKIKIDYDMQNITTQKVVISDLDIVNHVNSFKYLEWCLNTEKLTFLLENKIKLIEMNFLKELSLNDCYTVQKTNLSNEVVYTVNSEANTNFVLKVGY